MIVEQKRIGAIDSALIEYTRNRRVLMVGGTGTRQEAYQTIKNTFRLASLEWVTNETNQDKMYTRLSDSMRPGKYDLILVLIRWISHKHMMISQAAKACGIPVVTIPGGYGVHSIADAIRKQADLSAPRSAPTPSAPSTPRTESASPERRAESTGWIYENPTAGYSDFKIAFPERELDSAWFFAQKRKIGVVPASIPASPHQQEISKMTNAPSHRNSGMNENANKVRDYLQKLPKDKINAMIYTEYVKQTGHACKNYTFSNVKRALLKDASKREKQTIASKVMGGPFRGTLIEVVARVELKDFDGVPVGKMKEFALELVKQMHPQGGGASIIVLAEPMALEIRVPT